MHHVKKLFFVPVGLPGMGKSTLAKHLKDSLLANEKVSGNFTNVAHLN